MPHQNITFQCCTVHSNTIFRSYLDKFFYKYNFQGKNTSQESSFSKNTKLINTKKKNREGKSSWKAQHSEQPHQTPYSPTIYIERENTNTHQTKPIKPTHSLLQWKCEKNPCLSLGFATRRQHRSSPIFQNILEWQRDSFFASNFKHPNTNPSPWTCTVGALPEMDPTRWTNPNGAHRAPTLLSKVCFSFLPVLLGFPQCGS